MERANQQSAILWDMDGVLVDTWDLHAQTWVQAFDEFKVPLDASQIQTCVDHEGWILGAL